MFLRTGGEEFDFIRRSGFYFGFLFGLFQVCFAARQHPFQNRLFLLALDAAFRNLNEPV